MHVPEDSPDTHGSSLLEGLAASLLKFNPRSAPASKSRFTFGMSGNVPFCEWAEVADMEWWDERCERRFGLVVDGWRPPAM